MEQEEGKRTGQAEAGAGRTKQAVSERHPLQHGEVWYPRPRLFKRFIRHKPLEILLCAVALPLEYQCCVVPDTFPHIHVVHICVIRRQAFNAEHFTGFIDNTDIIQAKDIQLDIHQVVKLLHVYHGHWVV